MGGFFKGDTSISTQTHPDSLMNNRAQGGLQQNLNPSLLIIK